MITGHPEPVGMRVVYEPINEQTANWRFARCLTVGEKDRTAWWCLKVCLWHKEEEECADVVFQVDDLEFVCHHVETHGEHDGSVVLLIRGEGGYFEFAGIQPVDEAVEEDDVAIWNFEDSIGPGFFECLFEYWRC